jgi:CheY-like chemotaxis protein
MSGKTQYKYSNKRYLKSGGLADLYTATLVNGNTVVVREFRETLRDNKKLRKLFWQGVKIRNRLQPHPNVLGSLDYGTRDGMMFELLSYVDGPDLRQVLEGHSSLRIEHHYMPFMAAIAAGIRHIHLSGFFHLDIKPENILIKSFDGELIPRITDFDLATLKKATKISRVGTVNYMTPECLRDGEINFSSDVYAFAVLAYRLLVGELPFPAEIASESRRQKEQSTWTPLKHLSRDIPIAFSNLIDACLSPQLNDRPHIKEVAAETHKLAQKAEAPAEPAIVELTDWLADFEMHATAQLEGAMQAPKPVAEPAKTHTILVVEDAPGMADLMQLILEKDGHNVLMTNDGRMALEAIHDPHVSIDLVVSDIVMPYIGGVELMNKVRSMHPTMPFILVTGHSQDIAYGQLTAGGAVIVNKPFTSSDLLDAVRGMLEN